jgi:regulatory protein
VSPDRIVTDIKQQKRSALRYSVFVGGVYSFSLTDLALTTSGLRIGEALTEQEELEYQRGSEEAKVYELAVRFISYRPRSIEEMRTYFRRKSVDDDVAEATIVNLEKQGLLSDRTFAASWIANRQIQRPRSKRRLAQELQAKGLSQDDIEVALMEVDNESEIDNLVRLIEKKRHLSQYQSSEKLIGYLLRQGYPYELTKKALARLDDQ